MTKQRLLILMACFLMILGCSSQEVVTVVREVPVLTPDSLLVDPCDVVAAGDSVRSLAAGYISNTNCVGQYKLLLEKQRKHKAQVEELFKNGNTTGKY